MITVNPSSIPRAMLDLKDAIRDPDTRWKLIPVLRWSYHNPSDNLYVGCAYLMTHYDVERGKGRARDFYRGDVDVEEKVVYVNSMTTEYATHMIHTITKLNDVFHDYTIKGLD